MKTEKEIILAIEEVNMYAPIENADKWDDDEKSGYKITTNKQEIYILIGNKESCSESFGYMVSEDNIQDFVGAEILKIEAVQRIGEENKIIATEIANMNKDRGCKNDWENSAEFISIHTSKGLLQFSVYNVHNGYYGHFVYIKFNDTTIYKIL